MIARVVDGARGETDRLAGVTKVAIDEKAYRKGPPLPHGRHRPGHRPGGLGRRGPARATVEKFFTALGPERAAGLTHVGCDGADWIRTVVRARAPTAGLCLDSFPVLA